MASMEVMRDFVSSKYSPNWVKKLPDYQVASIYNRLVHEKPKEKKPESKKLDDGVQLDMFDILFKEE